MTNTPLPSFITTHARFLSFGLLGAFASGFGQTYYFAVFLGAIRGDLGLSHSEASNIYALGTITSAVLLALTGGWIDRWHLRNYCILACLIMAVACLTAGYATGPIVLFFAVAGLRFSGQGMMTHMAMTSMARYFTARRGAAISIASAGMSLGASLFPVAGVMSMNAVGWRTSWLIAAGVILALFLPMLLELLRGHRKRHILYLRDLNRERRRTEAATGVATPPPGTGRPWRILFLDPRVWVILPCMVAVPMILTGVTLHQVAVVTAKDWPLDTFAASYVISAGTSVLMAMITGVLVDKTGSSRWLLLVIGVSGTAQVLTLWQGTSIPTIWMYMLLNGVTMGSFTTVQGSLWPELFGRAQLGAIRGLVQPVFVFGSAVAPIIFGYMLDLTDGSITPMLLASAGYFVVTTLLVLPWVLASLIKKGKPSPQGE